MFRQRLRKVQVPGTQFFGETPGKQEVCIIYREVDYES